MTNLLLPRKAGQSVRLAQLPENMRNGCKCKACRHAPQRQFQSIEWVVLHT